MSSYKSKSATLDEINKWSKNKLINPRTKRKIKKTSPIYKYLNNQFIYLTIALFLTEPSSYI